MSLTSIYREYYVYGERCEEGRSQHVRCHVRCLVCEVYYDVHRECHDPAVVHSNCQDTTVIES